MNKTGNNKYNPKSASPKKLIDKIKKDENDNNIELNEEDNDNNLKYNLMPDEDNSYNSELFTLGNATTPNLNNIKNGNNKKLHALKIKL